MRKLLLLLGLLLVCGLPASAQNSFYSDHALRYNTGFPAYPASGAVISVCTFTGIGLPCSPLAPICSGPTDLTCAAPNPFNADANGNFGFWAPPGFYIVTITGANLNGYTLTVSQDVPVSGTVTNATNATNLLGPGTISGAFGGSPSLSGTWNFAGITDSGGATITGPLNANGGGNLAGIFTGNATPTGTWIFTGQLGAKAFENMQFCDQFSGATADVQINAAVTALPANGGTIDCRGYGATTQTIAATVNVGTNTKTVTMLLDRTTSYKCTITNNTPCFQKGPGSAMIGVGDSITNPNAGITFASNANISAAIFDQQNNGGNFVSSHVEGISIFGNSTMTVSDALLSLQCPLQVTDYSKMNIGGLGLTNSILVKIYGTTSCGAGNVDFQNSQIECSAAAGCRPVWIGCTSAGSTTLVSCPSIGGISFTGYGSAYVHPGTGGIPIFDIECGNGAGGTNNCGNFSFNNIQIESSHTSDIGILDNGASALTVSSLVASASVNPGADIVRISQPAGTTLDGVNLTGITNSGLWTNTVNNTVISDAVAAASCANGCNYRYTKGGSNALSTNIWADANGRQLTVDANGVAPRPTTFANLGTPPNGVLKYCSDCTIANPCAGSGTGAMAKRLNGVWVCN